MATQSFSLLGILALCWLTAIILTLVVPGDRVRRVVGGLIPAAGLVAMLVFGQTLGPGLRLLVSSLGLLYLLKATILLQRSQATVRAFSPWGLALYFSVWPGMDPAPFQQRAGVDPALLKAAEGRFPGGYVSMVVGVVLAVLSAVFQPNLGTMAVGWLGIAAVLLVIHFGVSEILTLALRGFGWPVGMLFDQPWRSRSLRDFWSRRWNLAFVEMDRLLFFTPLRRRFGVLSATFGVFLISGLLHELALSYPAGSGWGGPLVYFALHGALVLAEARLLRVEKRWPLGIGRLWTWFWVLGPLPLLFHAPFRESLIVPFYATLHTLICSHTLTWWFHLALWLAGAGHFCVLIASFQVPTRLGWHDDLLKLSPFNRKVMWTYGATIVLTIVAFGTVTLVLHDELLRGGSAARAISLFIGVFWLFRILVDAFYFRHEDWPKGPLFTVGHALLTSLFVALSGTYLGLFLWRQL